VSATVPGVPFVLADGLKVVYEISLLRWFRRVPVGSTERGIVEAVER
jgi:hypothetical protein